MKLMKFVSAVFVLIAVAVPVDVLAQNPGVSIGPRVGYYKADGAEEGNYLFGGQLRLRSSSALGFEAAAEYRSGGEYGLGTPDQTVETSYVPVTGSLLLSLPISDAFVPYGVAGVGAYYTLFDYSEAAEALGAEDDNSFEFGYHLGFGVELPFSESLSLNADYRYVFLDAGDESFEELLNSDLDSNVISAGLNFSF